MAEKHTNRLTSPRLIALAAGTVAVAAALGWLLPRDPAIDDVPLGSMPAAAPTVPVIIYLIDTLRADRLGLYGYSRRPTSPAIDALAADSVVFDQAYAAAPWTLPSVASLVTSTFACEHGIVIYGRGLNPAVPTLAEQLAGIGYTTAAYFSNIHAGALANLSRGYQIAEEQLATANDRAGDTARFLREHAGGPFFLYLHTMEPHAPFATPPPAISRFGHLGVEERETIRALWKQYNELRSADWSAGRPLGTTDNTRVQTEMMRFLGDRRADYELLYDAAVAHADDNLRRTVEVLKRSGIWDKALFILLADHGEEFGEHGGWFHGQAVYDEQVRVPLLMHFPGGEFAGRRIGEHVSLVDVMPTVLDYLGRADLCAGCRGRSLLPLLSENAATTPSTNDVPTLRLNELQFYRPARERQGNLNVVLRSGRWKGIWNADPDTLELYDLERDPRESTDAGPANPDIVAGMRARAGAWLQECRDAERPPERRKSLDEATRERLRALGYVK